MSFEFTGATAAQKARRMLEREGISSVLRKIFNRRTGCRFLVIVSDRDAAVAERILQGGKV